MPRYRFALGSADTVREAGVVQSETFSSALDAITARMALGAGDTLEIGVAGFPPARYEWVATGGLDARAWRPAGLKAA